MKKEEREKTVMKLVVVETMTIKFKELPNPSHNTTNFKISAADHFLQSWAIVGITTQTETIVSTSTWRVSETGKHKTGGIRVRK